MIRVSSRGQLVEDVRMPVVKHLVEDAANDGAIRVLVAEVINGKLLER